MGRTVCAWSTTLTRQQTRGHRTPASLGFVVSGWAVSKISADLANRSNHPLTRHPLLGVRFYLAGGAMVAGRPIRQHAATGEPPTVVDNSLHPVGCYSSPVQPKLQSPLWWLQQGGDWCLLYTVCMYSTVYVYTTVYIHSTMGIRGYCNRERGQHGRQLQ